MVGIHLQLIFTDSTFKGNRTARGVYRAFQNDASGLTLMSCGYASTSLNNTANVVPRLLHRRLEHGFSQLLHRRHHTLQCTSTFSNSIIELVLLKTSNQMIRILSLFYIVDWYCLSGVWSAVVSVPDSHIQRGRGSLDLIQLHTESHYELRGFLSAN